MNMVPGSSWKTQQAESRGPHRLSLGEETGGAAHQEPQTPTGRIPDGSSQEKGFVSSPDDRNMLDYTWGFVFVFLVFWFLFCFVFVVNVVCFFCF